MKELFNTQEDRDAGVAYFRELKATAGWRLVVDSLTNQIEVLKEQILSKMGEGVALTEDILDKKREKLKAYQEAIDTPDYWIKRFETATPFKDDSDPYYTAESLAKTRKK